MRHLFAFLLALLLLAPSAHAYAITPPLKQGDTGPAVSTLQAQLKELGFFTYPTATGYFGALTKAAVMAFQETYRDLVLIPANLTKGTGYVGALTAAALNAASSKGGGGNSGKPPSLTFTTSPTTIIPPQTSTLTWSSSGATSCTGSSGWSGSKATSGAQAVSPAATTTYSLTCTNGTKQVSKSVTVGVPTSPIVTYTINASAAANGVIVPSDMVTVNAGASQTFTITPDTGYKVNTLTVDGSTVTPASSYTFSSVAANHTISATFISSNIAPSVQNASSNVSFNTPTTITFAGLDAENDNLTFSVVSAPLHGTLGTIDNSQTSSASVVYTPTSGYSGSDSFSFKANDGSVDSNIGTASITVQNGTVSTCSTGGTGITTTVGTNAQLMTALQAAKACDTILLSAGNYGTLYLYVGYQPWVQFAGEVTIKSADSSNPAVFNNVRLSGVKNLTIDGVKFDYVYKAGDAEWAAPFLIDYASSHLTIRNSVFDGDLAQGTGTYADGYGTGVGLRVDGNGLSYLTVENNKFFKWHRAATFGGGDYITVRGNEVSEIRSDGMDFADTDDVVIEGNYYHDFRQSVQSGDHMDMIQFWTNGTVSPSENITIRNNILDAKGGDYTQSIFMRNDRVDTGAAGLEMYYQNVLIENNTIHNGHIHGITVGETNGLIVRNNTLLHNIDAGGMDSIYIPVINMKDASLGVTISSNIVPSFSLTATASRTLSNNVVVQNQFPDRANYVGSLFVDGLAGELSNAGSDLMVIPGSTLEQTGAGSSFTRFNKNPATPVAYIIDTPGVGKNLNVHTLDASNVYGTSGKGTVSGASWDFGDGTSGSGVVTSHTYAQGGKYVVRVTLSTSVGTVVADKTIDVTDSKVVNMPLDGSLANLGSAPTATYTWSNAAYATGKTGLAAQFVPLSSGAMNLINIAGLEKQLSGITQLSWAMDVKANGTPTGRTLWMHTAFGNTITGTSLTANWYTPAGEVSQTVSSSALLDGNWHRIGAIYDGVAGIKKIYVDGVLVAQASVAPGSINIASNRALSIGAYPFGSQFNGLIDNVKVYQGVWPEIMTP